MGSREAHLTYPILNVYLGIPIRRLRVCIWKLLTSDTLFRSCLDGSAVDESSHMLQIYTSRDMVTGMDAAKGDEIVCGKDGCDEVFIKDHHNAKYCKTHRTPPTRKRYRYLRAQVVSDGSDERICALPNCDRVIVGRRANAIYCSREHSVMAAQERVRVRKVGIAKARNKEVAGAEPGIHLRRGEVYERLSETGDGQRIADGLVTQAAIAEIYGVTPASVNRGMEAWYYQTEMDKQHAEWRRPRLTRAMLPTELWQRLRNLGYKEEGTDEFNEIVDYLVRAYAMFSRRYFTLEGKRPIIEDFHLEWIRLIIICFATGSKQLVLSPPRHGKSETLVRFCIWLIVMDPEFRIMWVAANTDVAKLMLGAVKDHLESNEELIHATLPPGDRYKPGWGTNKPWSNKEIKVAQQKRVGQKSSSMLALGRTSKILSRDVDGLIVDDLEDFDTTREEGQRRYSRNKLAEIGTRKEERTGWVYIGSRQHPDDIPNNLMGRDGVASWRVHVTSAHEDCQLDPDIIDKHDGNGCVLFPAVRSYRWLLEKKEEMDDLGIPGAYEMRYLNKPIPETGIVFKMDVIREKALNKSRGLGIDQLGPGRLIAGLDPAPRGTQAAFLWHWADPTLSMVDLETQKAGGFEGAHELMRRWHAEYGLDLWVYEDNMSKDDFFRDPRLKEICYELGITVLKHTTGKNKHDPAYGISSMAPLYHDGTIDLPYGDANARQKVNLLLRQLSLWTTDGLKTGKNAKTDIKMAQWLPWPRMLKWIRNDTVQHKIVSQHESAYPMTRTQDGRVPWTTKYPR